MNSNTHEIVEKHLKTWFLEEDTLIVPDLGKFETFYSGSKIHPTIHHFSPPSKGIRFTESVKQDLDNRFAKHISQKEDISFAETQQIVQDYVENLKFSLNGQKRLAIRGFGTFLFTPEESIKKQRVFYQCRG